MVRSTSAILLKCLNLAIRLIFVGGGSTTDNSYFGLLDGALSYQCSTKEVVVVEP